MARIAGVDLPREKRVEYALRYIHGIGTTSSRRVLMQANVDFSTRVKELSGDQVARIAHIIENQEQVEGDRRRETQMNIKRLMDLGTYRGLRHRRNLPSRGQRTRSSSKKRS